MNAETYLKTSSSGHTTSITDSPPQPAKMGPLATGVSELVSMLYAPRDSNPEPAD